jgi:hypothetical protein
MADKDINIRVSTPGATGAQQQLNQTGQAVKELGNNVQNMAPKADQAAGAFSKFIGLLGSLGLLAALATAAKKIAGFFDTINAKCDEAVQKAGAVRQAYEGLFEAAGAYDEKSRKSVVKEAESLLVQSGAEANVGYPTIEAYNRQFKGAMPEADYKSGLQSALSYAARHGGNATPELLQMMRGWGLNTSQQQNDMYRLIMGASGQSGLTDEEMIDLVGRASPTARGLGWTPKQTISTLSTLAAGEIGRNKTMRPATILAEYAADPQKALKEYPALSNVREVVPVSEAADRAENQSFMQTQEARDAQTKARARQIVSQVKTEAQYSEDVREIGVAAASANAVENPIEQGLLDKLFYINPKAGEDWAAYKKWERSLTEEQRGYIHQRVKDYRKENGRNVANFGDPAEREFWYRVMTPQQKFEALTDDKSSPQPVQNTSIQQHYYNNTYFNQTPPGASPSISPEDTY